jgi:phosphoglycerate dehydrogenase-like enzyme
MLRVGTLCFIAALAWSITAHAVDTPASETAPEDVAALIARLGLIESATPVRDRPGWTKPRAVVVLALQPAMLESLRAVAPGVSLVAADTPEQAAKLAQDADAVIGFCTPEVLAAGVRVRWIQAYTAGVERCVAIPAVIERKVLLTNMQRVAGPVMAEHVLAMMLAFTRALDYYIPARSARRWSEDLSPTSHRLTLEGKTLLVVGLGGIGTEVAKRAHALGMKVDAIRASGRDGPDYVREVGLPADLAALSARADFIVNTTPLTAETQGVYNARFFNGVKRGAYFFNVGRGKSVVQPALIDALRSGQVAGAGLDVTDPEPLPADDPLWSLPNVIITPHVSAQTDIGETARAVIVRENLRRYVNGDRMLSVVDTAKGY